MKSKNSFIFKGLISLMLSLVMICGTAVTSLSAVTDQVVAAVKEPVRSAIPDAPAPAQATDETDIATQSASSAADYGIAEGSMLDAPADDDVLDIALDDDTPAAAPSAPLTLSREKNIDLAATGALTATEYYIGSSSSGYKLVNEGGWKIKNSSTKYLTVSAQGNSAQISWGNSGTTLTEGNASSDTSAQLKYNNGRVDFYISYSNGSFAASVSESNRVPIDAAVTSYIVTFNANGGSGSMDPVPNVSGSYTLPSNGFTAPDSKHFAGWKANNSGEIIAAGANYNVVESVTFYAQWTDGTPTPTEAPSESTSSDSITYTKQIEKKNPDNDDDYNYRLHLTVDGSKLLYEKEDPDDPSKKITGMSGAFIIDVVESMAATWDAAPESKWTKGEHAFNALYEGSTSFVNQFIGADTDNQVSAILMRGFDQAAYDDEEQTVPFSDWSRTTTVTDQQRQKFHNYQQNGKMPNYVAALMRAKNNFQTATSTNDKFVIFITGNAPGNALNTDGTSPGRGKSAAEIDELTRAYVDKFLAEEGISIYVIGMTKFGENGNADHGEHVYTNEAAKYMGDQSKSVTGKGGYFEVDDPNELVKTLINEILPVVKSTCDLTTDLKVTDTLSKYVDFAETKNLTATLYTGYNSTTGGWSKSTIFTENDAELTISGDTVTFSRATEIEGPFKLEIAFDIKTADGVLQNTDTYGSTGYPNKGDDGTDYSSTSYNNHNFSANKPGYYANSSATINYTLNGTAKSGTFIKPVVQAPAETPVQGKYIFQYTDRFGDTQEVTVPVTLNSREKTGYSGNGRQAGVPTFLWTNDAKTLYNNINPLVKAALALEGNEERGGDNWQKDASVYKCDLVWDNLTATTQGANVSYNTTEHSVTIEATTTPYKFTLLYYTVNGGTATLSGTANDLEYGKAVTFNPIYKGSTEYAYVEYTVPSDGFSYWSADPAGNIPITTNLTYGMIMRGDYMHDDEDDRIVHIYAQYKAPDKLWTPLIEEAKLTHTIDDDHDWVYLDYMTNYLSKDGTVVQEMEVKPEYGIVVAKYNSTLTTLTQEKMESVADKMIDKDKSSAYLDSGKTAIAYRFKYNDNEHISDFNRTLYTLKSDTSEADNKRFTAIAYIVVDDVKYYSLINTDITVIDLV